MKCKKKVLCLIDSLGPGGAQRQITGLAVFLKQRGYDVILVAYYDNRFYVDQILSVGVPYIYIRQAGARLTRFWHLARFIRKSKPNVVISYLETPSICACIAHFFNKRFKLIVSERNTTQHTGINEKIRFLLYQIVDFIVPNAYAQENYIKRQFPRLATKVLTIPNFVDLKYFTPVSERKRGKEPEIIIVATIWPSKNTMGFIDAVARLKAKGLSFHISWYGMDYTHLDYFGQCQQKIETLGVGRYIELKEKTTKINAKYQEADYFCLPSFYEGTPNAICEAMACGLPVACSDVCDNSRYVRDGENGFLFNPKNADSMAIAIEKLLSLDKVNYNSFCVRSRERAKAMLSEEKFVESYIKLIEQ